MIIHIAPPTSGREKCHTYTGAIDGKARKKDIQKYLKNEAFCGIILYKNGRRLHFDGMYSGMGLTSE
jgi:hypothetical protein